MPFRSYGGTNLDLAPNRNMRRYILLSDEPWLILTDSLFMEVCQIFIHLLVVPQLNQVHQICSGKMCCDPTLQIKRQNEETLRHF
jgi:hypothetical protein